MPMANTMSSNQLSAGKVVRKEEVDAVLALAPAQGKRLLELLMLVSL